MSMRALALAMATLAACPDDPPGGTTPPPGPVDPNDPPPIDGLEALRIEPASIRVVDDGVAPGEIAVVRAIGRFDSGERDVSSEVGWRVEDPALGTIDRGTFTSAGVGGEGRIRAGAGAVEAFAALTVVVDSVVVVAGNPPDAPSRFPADETQDVVGGPEAPSILYPSHETMFPLNLIGVLHQWRASMNASLYEVRFRSDLADVRYYTCVISLGDPTADRLSHFTAWMSLRSHDVRLFRRPGGVRFVSGLDQRLHRGAVGSRLGEGFGSARYGA